MDKINEFIKRNRKRNAHLYKDGLEEGYDYIVCPISGERLSMIKDSYITRVLGIQVTDYPNVNRICDKRKENIKSGLKKLDPVTGLTKYEVGQVKARQILKTVDTDGKSGYKRKGEKTRATHMSKVDSLGRNGYSQLATRAILKGNQTKANKGLISIDRTEFKRYKLVILYLTAKFRNTLSTGYVTGLAGKAGAYHIDHKFSILEGYKQKISPLLIGHISNLEMIGWEKNLNKKSNCSIQIDDLYSQTGYTALRSQQEFELILKLIQSDITNKVPPNAAFLLERFYESDLRT